MLLLKLIAALSFFLILGEFQRCFEISITELNGRVSAGEDPSSISSASVLISIFWKWKFKLEDL